MTGGRGRPELAVLAEIHALLSNDRPGPAVTPTPPPPSRLPFPERAAAPGPRIGLPPPGPAVAAALSEVLSQRRSQREFAAEPLALGTLADLLRLSYGTGRTVPAMGYRRYPLSVAPSAGGLQPVNLYLVARHVSGLARGVYYFHPYFHDLRTVDDRDPDPQLRAAVIQPEFHTAPALLVATASLDRTLWKYSLRHYRTVHIDTGVVAQNVQLVATALRLACCAIVGFYEQAAADLVQVDHPGEVVTLFIALGQPVAGAGR